MIGRNMKKLVCILIKIIECLLLIIIVITTATIIISTTKTIIIIGIIITTTSINFAILSVIDLFALFFNPPSLECQKGRKC